MSTAFTKVFASLLDSSVWVQPNHIRLVWMTMLAMVDRDGCVEASVLALSRRAVVSRAECEEALACLLAPDPDSRSKAHEGRRIATTERGWKLLNYHAFRDKANADDRREKDAARKQAKRDRDADAADSSAVVRSRPQSSASRPQCHDIGEGDAEGEVDAEGEGDPERALSAIELNSPPRTAAPSREPASIVRRLFADAYLATRKTIWAHAAHDREIGQLATWADQQARADGVDVEHVVARVIAAACADTYLVGADLPLRLIVKQAGALYRPPPKAAGPRPAMANVPAGMGTTIPELTAAQEADMEAALEKRNGGMRR